MGYQGFSLMAGLDLGFGFESDLLLFVFLI